MPGVLDGIRVVELATWGFVPSAGVALADWGAEVIKVEHPVHGDPMRGLVSGSLRCQGRAPNSVHVRDLQSEQIQCRHRPDGRLRSRGAAAARRHRRRLLDELPDAGAQKAAGRRRRSAAVNPRLVYARGSGLGPDGDEADTGGFDLASYWSRGGVGYLSTDAALNTRRRCPAPLSETCNPVSTPQVA